MWKYQGSNTAYGWLHVRQTKRSPFQILTTHGGEIWLPHCFILILILTLSESWLLEANVLTTIINAVSMLFGIREQKNKPEQRSKAQGQAVGVNKKSGSNVTQHTAYYNTIRSLMPPTDVCNCPIRMSRRWIDDMMWCTQTAKERQILQHS